MRQFRIWGPLLWLLLCSPAQSQELNASIEAERGILAKLKTAYLFNMVKFVTWPQQGDTVSLCLRANSPVMRYAEQLDGRRLGDGRRLRIGSIAELDAGCSIIYDDAEAKDRSGALESWDVGSVLTISDNPSAIAEGFTIQLFFDANKLQFAVNPVRVREGSFQISSKLMRLARPSAES